MSTSDHKHNFHLRSEILCLIAIAVIFIVINSRWLWVFRHGQLLDVDEAGYLSSAITDYLGFVHNGAKGFFAAVWAPSAIAPLTNAVSALIFGIVGPHVIVGLGTPLLAGAATIFATYLLGASVGSPKQGLMGAALTASCPFIIDFSRSLQFAVPAAFVATMALAAIVRSDRFRYFGWASVFGICCGLLPLTRTMTIAFVPGLILGAVVYVVHRTDRRPCILILGWSLLLTLIVAGAWLVPNGRYVFEYLLRFGYRNHAAEYGPTQMRFGIENWRLEAQVLLNNVHLPHFLLILSGAAAMTILVGRAVDQIGVSATLRVAASSKIVPLVFFVSEAMLALASSQNKGQAFFAPLVPTAIVLAVWSFCRLCEQGFYRWVLATIAILVTGLGVVPSIDLRLGVAKPWTIDLPLLGRSIITDGRAPIDVWEGYFVTGTALEPIPPAKGQEWIDLNSETATILRQAGNGTTAGLGFRHAFYNFNTINLQSLLIYGEPVRLVEADPIDTGDTTAGDLRWLTEGSAAHACVLLITDDEEWQFVPIVNTGRMKDAAIQAGFQPVNQRIMPNGHLVVLMRRQASQGYCKPLSEGGGATPFVTSCE